MIVVGRRIGPYARCRTSRLSSHFGTHGSGALIYVRAVVRADIFSLRGISRPNERIICVIVTGCHNSFGLGCAVSVIRRRISPYSRSRTSRLGGNFRGYDSVVKFNVLAVVRADVFSLSGIISPNERIKDVIVTGCRNSFGLGCAVSVISRRISPYARRRTSRLSSYLIGYSCVVKFNMVAVVRADVFNLRSISVPNERIEDVIVTGCRNSFGLGCAVSVISRRISPYSRSRTSRLGGNFRGYDSVVKFNVIAVVRANVFSLSGISVPNERIKGVVVTRSRDNFRLTIGKSAKRRSISPYSRCRTSGCGSHAFGNVYVKIGQVKGVVRADVFGSRRKPVPHKRIERIFMNELRYLFRFSLSANRAGINHLACRFTRCGGGYLAVVPDMRRLAFFKVAVTLVCASMPMILVVTRPIFGIGM